MRLINTKTLALEEFYGEIPPYAILSHRWESEEVTFKDYSSQADPGNREPMQGFRKIRYCIDQAIRDNLEYCWVDTCCIDKSSSAELTEAINSMYAWYRDSRMCYIYMSDVVANNWSANLTEQFESSQWFSRGWTLQELLAPRLRLFFDANWRFLTKLDSDVIEKNPNPLLASVMRATQIPASVLQEFSSAIKRYSVAMKMSWASQRQTTRIEDMAYCLMGLFGITMPLLYGEGSQAFLRLQEEIMKKTDDHSIFCWTDPAATDFTYRGLLARSPAEFSESSGVISGDRRDPPLSDDLSLVWPEDQIDHLKPYSITNRGLRITLPLQRCSPKPSFDCYHGEFWARLECLVAVDADTYVQCVLLLAHLGNGKFARVGVQSLLRLPESREFAPAREIFVSQDLDVSPWYSSPRMSGVVFGWCEPSSPKVKRIRIVKATPDSLWDGSSMAIWLGLAPLDVTANSDKVHIATITFEATVANAQSSDSTPFFFTVLLEWVIIEDTSEGNRQDHQLRRVGPRFVEPDSCYEPTSTFHPISSGKYAYSATAWKRNNLHGLALYYITVAEGDGIKLKVEFDPAFRRGPKI